MTGVISRYKAVFIILTFAALAALVWFLAFRHKEVKIPARGVYVINLLDSREEI